MDDSCLELVGLSPTTENKIWIPLVQFEQFQFATQPLPAFITRFKRPFQLERVSHEDFLSI